MGRGGEGGGGRGGEGRGGGGGGVRRGEGGEGYVMGNIHRRLFKDCCAKKMKEKRKEKKNKTPNKKIWELKQKEVK